MYRNIIITALRNVRRQPGYALANILGLAVGMTCCLLIMVFVRYEFSIDADHSRGDRIYKLISWTDESDGQRKYNSGTSGPVGLALKDQFPEVEDVVRFHWNWVGFLHEGNKVQGSFAIVDSSIANIFDVKMIAGDLSALADPANVLISESFAERCFSETDPIGQTVTLDERLTGGDYLVAGVYEDLPSPATWPLFLDVITTRQNPLAAFLNIVSSRSLRMKDSSFQTVSETPGGMRACASSTYART